MSIWVLSDLHLPFGAPEKTMEIFGKEWENYTQEIETNWRGAVKKEDLVLIPGDISWATHLKDALVDLQWIAALPGTKLLLKGNHDYWWPSSKKLKEALPPSIHFIHNTAFTWNEATIGGSRLWDFEGFSFDSYIISIPTDSAPSNEEKDLAAQRKIYEREVQRLELSLQKLKREAKWRIAMTHYPPIGADLKESPATKILEAYEIDICVFGHLHNVDPKPSLFGEKNGIRYIFASADYLGFKPLLLPLS